MRQRSRREFLEDVGSGMLITGLGASLASDLGISTAFASEGGDSLDFGALQPLVELMQDTPAQKLQPMLVKKLKDGQVDLRQLVASAALANAETFGGQDYVGFHTEMALLPAWQMTQELPTERQALPVLKVLYRNTHRIQESGVSEDKTLKKVQPADLTNGGDDILRQATRAGDMNRAERIFAAQAGGSLDDAYNSLLTAVRDTGDVHRFVLAHRAFGLIDVVGSEHAHTMLRQSVRFCVDREQQRHERGWKEPETRKLIPRLIDEHGLLSKKPGTREPDDAWFEEMSQFIHKSSGRDAMEAVAAALGEGISLEAVGQAASLAANRLVLTQGTRKDGSHRCHGDSPGVHSSDSINAWRNMARVASQRNAIAGLLVGTYHVGGFRTYQVEAPYPLSEHRATVKSTDAKSLLAEADAAIRDNDQGRAAAAMAIYGEQGHDLRSALDLMLGFAISEDGRLHSEKYYRTVTEEYATTRPAFRWRQIVSLARVTASSYGYDRFDNAGHRAPGYEDACRLLGVTG